MGTGWLLSVMGTVLFLASPALLSPQAPYSGEVPMDRGQDVTPAFEGWMPNPDGTISMWFGYMNRNYKEELDVPIGPDNNVDPGGDRGQPTHFYPRRQRMVFSVVVPKDWGLNKKVLWTITIRGKTNVAKGWLQPEWQIDKEVIMQQVGGSDLDNQPPVFVSASDSQTVTLPNSVTLTATAQDDGRPKPRRVRDIEDLGGSEPLGPETSDIGDDGQLQNAGDLRIACDCERRRADDFSRRNGHREISGLQVDEDVLCTSCCECEDVRECSRHPLCFD
jgi:hypothetical protein